MLDRDDHDVIVKDSVHNDVARAGNNEFTRTLDPARSAKVWPVRKAANGGDDRLPYAFCRSGIVLCNIASSAFQAVDGDLAPDDVHPELLFFGLRPGQLLIRIPRLNPGRYVLVRNTRFAGARFRQPPLDLT